ncbi:hypothetical protein QE152_g5516 [Popillia japonica]|uniref:Uncharacterized protein n=1 Tax=Popillia japonica TaxID=7064 RepID=A0AAW1MMF5_POPJA
MNYLKKRKSWTQHAAEDNMVHTVDFDVTVTQTSVPVTSPRTLDNLSSEDELPVTSFEKPKRKKSVVSDPLQNVRRKQKISRNKNLSRKELEWFAEHIWDHDDSEDGLDGDRSDLDSEDNDGDNNQADEQNIDMENIPIEFEDCVLYGVVEYWPGAREEQIGRPENETSDEEQTEEVRSKVNKKLKKVIWKKEEFTLR